MSSYEPEPVIEDGPWVIFPKTAPERSEIGIGAKLLSRESARKKFWWSAI